MGGQGRDMEELQTDPQADLGTAQPLSQAALEAPTESHTILFSNPQSSAQAGHAPPPQPGTFDFGFSLLLEDPQVTSGISWVL